MSKVFYPDLKMTEEKRQEKIAELRANPNRQPSDDAELDRLLNHAGEPKVKGEKKEEEKKKAVETDKDKKVESKKK